VFDGRVQKVVGNKQRKQDNDREKRGDTMKTKALSKGAIDRADADPLPCPHCNGVPSLKMGPFGTVLVACEECGATSGWKDTRFLAVSAWNRRRVHSKSQLGDQRTDFLWGMSQTKQGKESLTPTCSPPRGYASPKCSSHCSSRRGSSCRSARVR